MFRASGSAADPTHPDERDAFEPLEHVTLQFDLGWAPDTVWQLLFADESRFTQDWHLKAQDALNGVVGAWTDDGQRQRRTVTFKQRIDNPLSPVRASQCVWSQWALCDLQRGLVFELKSDLLDVPFGDAWSLYWRWLFTPTDVGRGSHVTLSTQACFWKFLMWKSKISSETVRAGHEMSPDLEAMASADALSKVTPPRVDGGVRKADARTPKGGDGSTERLGHRHKLSIEAAVIAVSLDEMAKLTPRQRAEQVLLSKQLHDMERRAELSSSPQPLRLRAA
ncbi:hypothetical protein KFE25_001107 [Diacronema lutheri]|uniref:VASt domain-containing protein n=1 Tax=Diacronema lutheri TaxID=2081491 RepID=A0A8J5XD30_DIALT|nr:hypothetical protein KFE25_001107 [Diacronema lutheri]